MHTQALTFTQACAEFPAADMAVVRTYLEKLASFYQDEHILATIEERLNAAALSRECWEQIILDAHADRS